MKKLLQIFLISIFFSIQVFGYDLPYNKTLTAYEQAFEEINCMLDGTCPLSFKKAVFAIENAYYSNTLKLNTIEEDITFLKDLAIDFRKANTLIYDSNDPLDKEKTEKNAAIFKVMTDTIVKLIIK